MLRPSDIKLFLPALRKYKYYISQNSNNFKLNSDLQNTSEVAILLVSISIKSSQRVKQPD
jgi:hypothetical protein